MNRRNEFLTNMRNRLLRPMMPVQALFISSALLLGVSSVASAAVVPDVRNTNHNLSVNAPSTATVKATSESQVCVFCHTPHAATQGIVAPLWNRKLSSATYTSYNSSSIEANAAELAAGPGGSSKLCLSCHDGTLAVGSVNVLNGQADVSISMSGTDSGHMPAGAGATTGFTRNLGVNLSNDHPISITYNDTLAEADGELRKITGNPVVGNRVPGSGSNPKFPLENGQMQCATCHDPHIRETDASKGNRKFLRGNRFQESAPTGGAYDVSSDIVCLSCHDKAGQAWANSAHANPLVADETYLADAAALREFPANTPVWKAACQNCHDTHTVQGSRRLLREGNESTASPKIAGAPSIEQTCYQCHSASGTSVVTPLTTVPNIKNEFAKAIRMPITNSEQGVSTEAHDIGTAGLSKGGKDFTEGKAQLGVGHPDNRHAECTDCHNPHRMVRNAKFYGNGGNTTTPDTVGTHKHTDDATTQHDNIASGVLRGTFGVEPVYGSASFYEMPVSFDVKRGDPGSSSSTLVSEPYVTREYQICLKCHSNYGYDDNNIYPIGNRPMLGGPGKTASGSNGLTMYTNQAREFQAPLAHQGEPLSVGADGNPGSAWNTNNHRGWHPVMGPTGRTAAKRGMSSSGAFLPPWNNAVGTQTMFCADCHGDNTTSATSVIPDGGVNGNPWGPHGSSNPFLLKGKWVDATASTANMLCFKCHKKSTYGGSGDGDGNRGETGFSGGEKNLHNYHSDRGSGGFRCSWCHVAVPHGWKNKQLLVNLNDVGAEAGYPGEHNQVAVDYGNWYTKEPYYYKALNKITTFAASGHWQESNCGAKTQTGGRLVPGTNGNTRNNSDTGKDWMDVCGD